MLSTPSTAHTGGERGINQCSPHPPRPIEVGNGDKSVLPTPFAARTAGERGINKPMLPTARLTAGYGPVQPLAKRFQKGLSPADLPEAVAFGLPQPLPLSDRCEQPRAAAKRPPLTPGAWRCTVARSLEICTVWGYVSLSPGLSLPGMDSPQSPLRSDKRPSGLAPKAPVRRLPTAPCRALGDLGWRGGKADSSVPGPVQRSGTFLKAVCFNWVLQLLGKAPSAGAR